MRASLYLLAAALFDEPRPEQREALSALLRHVVFRSPVDAPWIPPLLEVADTLKSRSSLDTEYVRLFVLAAPRVVAQPYGSYWLEPERRLMGETTQQVTALMRRHGLQPARESGLLPDHLVSELQFMAWLAEHEAQEETRATQQQLLDQHLARWVPPFIAALQGCQPPRYYRMAARYLGALLVWDQRRLHAQPDPRPLAA